MEDCGNKARRKILGEDRAKFTPLGCCCYEFLMNDGDDKTAWQNCAFADMQQLVNEKAGKKVGRQNCEKCEFIDIFSSNIFLGLQNVNHSWQLFIYSTQITSRLPNWKPGKNRIFLNCWKFKKVMRTENGLWPNFEI